MPKVVLQSFFGHRYFSQLLYGSPAPARSPNFHYGTFPTVHPHSFLAAPDCPSFPVSSQARNSNPTALNFPLCFPQPKKRGKEMLLAPLCRCGKLSFFSVRDVRESGFAGFSRKCSTVSAARQKLLNFRSYSLKEVGNAAPFPCQIVFFFFLML